MQATQASEGCQTSTCARSVQVNKCELYQHDDGGDDDNSVGGDGDGDGDGVDGDRGKNDYDNSGSTNPFSS